MSRGPVTCYAKLLGPGFVLYMQSPGAVIGRDAKGRKGGADLEIGPGPRISRAHARVEFSRTVGRFFIQCLSRNGMFVDGRYLNPHCMPVYLDHGSLIQIADVLFYFLLPDKALPRSLTPRSVTLLPPAAAWSPRERDAVVGALLRYGLCGRGVARLRTALGPGGEARTDADIKAFTAKIFARLAQLSVKVDPRVAVRVATEASQLGEARTGDPRQYSALVGWPAKPALAAAWARRVLTINEVHRAVETYGESAAVDGVSDIALRVGVSWWGRRENIDLLVGIHRHGFGDTAALSADATLCFGDVGDGTEGRRCWPRPDALGAQLEEILRAIRIRDRKYAESKSRRKQRPAGRIKVGPSPPKPDSELDASPRGVNTKIPMPSPSASPSPPPSVSSSAEPPAKRPRTDTAAN